MVEKIVLLVVFFAVMIFVGLRSRKHTKSVSDFVLGGRRVGPWLTAFSFGTSYFSSVVFVGYAGQFGWNFGISATWIGIGNALLGSLMAWGILGRRTRVMSHHLSASTMPEFFEKRYDSRIIKIVASAIIFIFMIPYTASIYNGLSKLFGMAFNIPYEICVIVMAVLTGVYVIVGGYMATAINDFIQGIIMLIGIGAVILAVLNGQGGFTEAFGKLASIEGDVPGTYASIFGPDPMGLLSVVVLTSLGTWGLPQMVHKFYTIKDEKSIRTGSIVSTAFAFVVAGGSYFLGGFGRLFDAANFTGPDGKIAFDSIVPYMISDLPDILIGIVVVLVLSASMSTLASLVMTSSSTLTLDFIKGTVAKNMKEKTQLVVLRVLIAVFIVISVILALDPPTFIAQLMGISWGAMAGSFLAPFLYGLYWKGITKAGVWASFACGVGITVSNMFIGYLPNSIYAGAIAMVAGLIVTPIVSLITPKLKKEVVDGSFSCYQASIKDRNQESLIKDENK